MRTPLFVVMKMARDSKRVPLEVSHSGILSFQWMRENNRLPWLFSWQQPSGTDSVYAITSRVFRGRVVRMKDYSAVLERVARSIYDHGGPLANFIRHHVTPRSRCGHYDGLVFNGVTVGYGPLKRIPIVPAKMKPCRWCGTQTFYKDSWLDYNKTIRCNRPDCRRIDYLQDTPQSRGGVDLTPAQRQALSPAAWNGQRALNYLNLIAKEIKRNGRKPTGNLRRRSAHDSANHR